MTRAAWWIGGGLLAVPALVQLALLAWAIAGRIAYPYDLEWMEGGLLVHADRLAQGLSIYPPPSVDFIPYPYTPGYPALLGVVGRIFGLSYPVGRAVGVVALVAILAIGAWALVRAREPRDRAPAALGAILAWGVIAATYPWLDGWLDLVRGDVVFLAIALVGFVWLDRALEAPRAWPGVIGAATVLAGSFFFKQTGVLLVAAGGVLVAARRWRCVPAYVVIAGVLGLGGTWLLDRMTDGWFWVYVFRIHQQHPFSRGRFLRSFGHILLHFPAVTLVVLLALVLVIAARLGRDEWPPGTRSLATWAWLAAAGTVVGATGWAIEWAHFNAYLPAMVLLAFAAGAALPAVAGAARALAPARRPLADLLVGVAALSIAVNLALAQLAPQPLRAERRRPGGGGRPRRAPRLHPRRGLRPVASLVRRACRQAPLRAPHGRHGNDLPATRSRVAPGCQRRRRRSRVFAKRCRAGASTWWCSTTAGTSGSSPRSRPGTVSRKCSPTAIRLASCRGGPPAHAASTSRRRARRCRRPARVLPSALSGALRRPARGQAAAR